MAAANEDWVDVVGEQEAANFDHTRGDNHGGTEDAELEDHQSSNTAVHEDVNAQRLRACVEQLASAPTTRKLELVSTVHGVGLVACCVVLALLIAALPLHAPAPPDAAPAPSAELDALHATLQQELQANAALQAQLQDAHRAVNRAHARADHLNQLLLIERRRADNLLGMLDAVHQAAHASTHKATQHTKACSGAEKHESLSQQLMVERTARMALETAALHDVATMGGVAACWHTMAVLEQVQVNISAPGTLVRAMMRTRPSGSV